MIRNIHIVSHCLKKLKARSSLSFNFPFFVLPLQSSKQQACVLESYTVWFNRVEIIQMQLVCKEDFCLKKNFPLLAAIDRHLNVQIVFLLSWWPFLAPVLLSLAGRTSPASSPEKTGGLRARNPRNVKAPPRYRDSIPDVCEMAKLKGKRSQRQALPSENRVHRKTKREDYRPSEERSDYSDNSTENRFFQVQTENGGLRRIKTGHNIITAHPIKVPMPSFLCYPCPLCMGIVPLCIYSRASDPFWNLGCCSSVHLFVFSGL